MYHIFFIHSSVDGYLGCFHVLAFGNSAPVNLGCMLLLFSCELVSHSSWPLGLLHARFPCPLPCPRVFPSLCSLHWWHHPAISSSVTLFSFCLQSFPASGSFPTSWPFISCGQSTGASASASVLQMSIQDWFPLRLTGLISLLCKSLLQHHSLKASILWRSAFFMVQLSELYVTEKTIALSIQTFVSKMMSLLFNTLSGFFIAFLPRSNSMLISWLPFAVILEPKLLPLFPLQFAMKLLGQMPWS